MRYLLAVSLGKSLRYLLRLIRRGGGSALPGLIVSKLAPGFLSRTLTKLPMGVVLVSGSAGKSSTTQTLVRLLEAHGIRVFTNPSTANIRQGYYSAILESGDLFGRLEFDIAVIEADEGHGVSLAREVRPRLVVLTNVLSDQLDRFNDPSYVVSMLQSIVDLSAAAVINADDPNLAQLTLPEPTHAAGLSGELLLSKEAPSYAFNFTPTPELIRSARVVSGGVEMAGSAFPSSSESLEHLMNDALALLAASQLVDLQVESARRVLASPARVFARNERVVIQDREVTLRLVQNPTSFQLNLDELSGSETPLMLMAGSDIHDPSWLWTVDFSKLQKVDIVSGSNAYDLALRLDFAGVEINDVEPDIAAATDKFLALSGEHATILFSADAMRRTRRHWGLAK